jgi:hypothetical protein
MIPAGAASVNSAVSLKVMPVLVVPVFVIFRKSALIATAAKLLIFSEAFIHSRFLKVDFHGSRMTSVG